MNILENMSARDGDGRFPMLLLGVLVGGIVAAVATGTVVYPQLGDDGEASGMMSYADLAAIVLAAVAVIVTVLSVFIAILAVWGFAFFRRSIRDAASNHLNQELRGGRFKDGLEKSAIDHVMKELESGKLRAVLEQRVDQILLGGAAERAAEDEANEEDTAP